MFTVKTFTADSFLSNMYVISEENCNSAIVIDPFESDEVTRYLLVSGISEVFILLTHEHFDHTTEVNKLQTECKCTLICHKICAEKIANKRNNRPLSLMAHIDDIDKYRRFKIYECKADITFEQDFNGTWN